MTVVSLDGWWWGCEIITKNVLLASDFPFLSVHPSFLPSLFISTPVRHVPIFLLCSTCITMQIMLI